MAVLEEVFAVLDKLQTNISSCNCIHTRLSVQSVFVHISWEPFRLTSSSHYCFANNMIFAYFIVHITFSFFGLMMFLLCCWFDSTFKKKAPNAIKEIRKFAQKAMGTTDVRVDVKLNKHIWSRGIRSVPRRVRVRIARRRNDDEDAKEELYSLVTVTEIPAEGLKGLGTKIIDEDDD